MATGTKKPMTVKDATRIERAKAHENGGQTPKVSFESRAKKAAARNLKNTIKK